MDQRRSFGNRDLIGYERVVLIILKWRVAWLFRIINVGRDGVFGVLFVTFSAVEKVMI